MANFPQSKQRENASKSEKKKTVQPSFQNWPDRMGKHLAYHVNPVNKLIHALCIPLELFGVLNLFSILANPLWLVIVLSPVFLCCDFIIGGSFVTALLLMAYYLAAQVPLLCGLVCFVGAFLFQTRVGHSYEEQGRDDTERNLQEFKDTKNLFPLLLIFFYHWVELFFWAGYAPGLAKQMNDARETERKKF